MARTRLSRSAANCYLKSVGKLDTSSMRRSGLPNKTMQNSVIADQRRNLTYHCSLLLASCRPLQQQEKGHPSYTSGETATESTQSYVHILAVKHAMLARPVSRAGLVHNGMKTTIWLRINIPGLKQARGGH